MRSTSTKQGKIQKTWGGGQTNINPLINWPGLWVKAQE